MTSAAVPSRSPSTRATPTTAVPASMPCSRVPVRRPTWLSSCRTSAKRACTVAASSVQRRTRWAWPREVRRSSRAATPSSMAAAWSVQAISSTTLRSEICGSSGRTTATAATPASGNRMKAGHQVRPATSHSGPEASSVRMAIHTLWRSSEPTSWVSSSTRSSTSPTACSSSAASGCSMAASSRSARSRPSARSVTPAQTVRPSESSTAAPTTHSASSQTRATLASSARRPATAEPAAVPMAPSSDPSRASTAHGLRIRRQSTGRRWAGGSVGGGVWRGAGWAPRSVIVTVPPTVCPRGPGAPLHFTTAPRCDEAHLPTGRRTHHAPPGRPGGAWWSCVRGAAASGAQTSNWPLSRRCLTSCRKRPASAPSTRRWS